MRFPSTGLEADSSSSVVTLTHPLLLQLFNRQNLSLPGQQDNTAALQTLVMQKKENDRPPNFNFAIQRLIWTGLFVSQCLLISISKFGGQAAGGGFARAGRVPPGIRWWRRP